MYARFECRYNTGWPRQSAHTYVHWHQPGITARGTYQSFRAGFLGYGRPSLVVEIE